MRDSKCSGLGCTVTPAGGMITVSPCRMAGPCCRLAPSISALRGCLPASSCPQASGVIRGCRPYHLLSCSSRVPWLWPRRRPQWRRGCRSAVGGCGQWAGLSRVGDRWLDSVRSKVVGSRGLADASTANALLLRIVSWHTHTHYNITPFVICEYCTFYTQTEFDSSGNHITRGMLQPSRAHAYT